jgi:DNA modification methylase
LTPYYQRNGITIYHGDCRDVLPLDADVLVTDPPYGIAFSSSWSGRFAGNRMANDDDNSLRDAVLEWWGDRPALVFGHWKTATPKATRALLVWDKGLHVGMGDLSIPWKPNHEFIYVIGRGFKGHRGSGVLAIKALSPNFVRQRHPTEKPEALLLELIAKCPDGVILDPFMGSGTTLAAAAQMGRSAVGIEVEEQYCEEAARRLSREVPFAESGSR